MNLSHLVREIERHVPCKAVPVSKIGGVIHPSGEIHTEIEEAIARC